MIRPLLFEMEKANSLEIQMSYLQDYIDDLGSGELERFTDEDIVRIYDIGRFGLAIYILMVAFKLDGNIVKNNSYSLIMPYFDFAIKLRNEEACIASSLVLLFHNGFGGKHNKLVSSKFIGKSTTKYDVDEVYRDYLHLFERCKTSQLPNSVDFEDINKQNINSNSEIIPQYRYNYTPTDFLDLDIKNDVKISFLDYISDRRKLTSTVTDYGFIHSITKPKKLVCGLEHFEKILETFKDGVKNKNHTELKDNFLESLKSLEEHIAYISVNNNIERHNEPSNSSYTSIYQEIKFRYLVFLKLNGDISEYKSMLYMNNFLRGSIEVDKLKVESLLEDREFSKALEIDLDIISKECQRVIYYNQMNLISKEELEEESEEDEYKSIINELGKIESLISIRTNKEFMEEYFCKYPHLKLNSNLLNRIVSVIIEGYSNKKSDPVFYDIHKVLTGSFEEKIIYDL